MMKRLMSLMMAGLMAVSLVGCSSGSSAATATPAPSEAPAEPQEDDKYGGVYTFAMFYVTNTFFTPKGSGSMKYFVTPSIEPVAREEADGTITPFLAESIDVDPDALTMTIKLHEGIKFHDGSELTAEVLKWNLDYAIEAGKAASLSNPKSVDVIDDYTVQISYDTWSVSWPADMTNVLVYSKKAYDENGEDWCAVNMIGTGPFVMQSYTVDDKIVWTKNEDYWQEGLPYLDGVELHWIYDTTASASAFLKGEIDNFDTSVAASIAIMEDAGVKSSAPKLTANCTFGFALPVSANQDSILSDLNVRKAILYGVDWAAVANAATGGYGFWSNQLGFEDAYNYDPDLPAVEYDLAKGQDFLNQRTTDKPLETTIWTITNNATNEAAATALAGELDKLGIAAKVEQVDTSVITPMRVNDCPEGFIVLGHALGRDMTTTLINNYSPMGTTQTHMIAFTDEYVDALNEAVTAATMDDRAAALRKAAGILTDKEVLLYPAFYMQKFQYTQDYVHDNGANQVSAFQWTPELIWKDADHR